MVFNRDLYLKKLISASNNDMIKIIAVPLKSKIVL